MNTSLGEHLLPFLKSEVFEIMPNFYLPITYFIHKIYKSFFLFCSFWPKIKSSFDQPWKKIHNQSYLNAESLYNQLKRMPSSD